MLGLAGQLKEAEGSRLFIQEQKSDEHRHAADDREQEKVQRRTVTVFAFAEKLDEEKCRHEGEFPVDEPVEEI